jgi:hypothetical protein
MQGKLAPAHFAMNHDAFNDSPSRRLRLLDPHPFSGKRKNFPDPKNLFAA